MVSEEQLQTTFLQLGKGCGLQFVAGDELRVKPASLQSAASDPAVPGLTGGASRKQSSTHG
jgi:hypothetical protein